MIINDEKTVVDIIGRYGPTGHFVKITDKNSMSFNNRINTFLNYIQMLEGNNGLFPDIGAFKTLNSIPFAESVASILATVSSGCQRDLGFEVSLSHSEDPHRYEYIIVEAEIADLPGVMQFDVNTNDKVFRIINPRYIKKEK